MVTAVGRSLLVSMPVARSRVALLGGRRGIGPGTGAVVYLPQGLHRAVQQDQLQRRRQWLLLEHGEEVGTVLGNED